MASRYLVDSAERGHIHSLPPDGTGTTDTGGVLTGSTVDDGVHQNLEGVLQQEDRNDIKAPENCNFSNIKYLTTATIKVSLEKTSYFTTVHLLGKCC